MPRWQRFTLVSLPFSASVLAVCALLMVTFAYPPERAALADDGGALVHLTAPPDAAPAGGIAGDDGGWFGLLYDLFGVYGWKAWLVLLLIASVSGLYIGGGKLARKLGWPEWVVSVLESSEFRLAAVFVLAYAIAYTKARIAGEVWGRPIFVASSQYAAQAITAHQIWKQTLRDRFWRLVGRPEAGS